MGEVIERINSYVWGAGLIFLLLATGIVYTLKLGFIQFRMPIYLLKSIKEHKSDENKGVSQLKTVCMSLGTAMGTGNITGVASAISIGGAGAVFWMWVSAFFGMALVYAENSLSARYSNDEVRGTMAYLERGLGSKKTACVFAFFCIGASFGMGGMVQVNAFAESLNECVNFNKFVLAFLVFMLIFWVIKGGAERISTASQVMLPIASLLYIIIGLTVIVKFRGNVLTVFSDIFSQALGLRQFTGGIAGYTVSQALSVGVRRGIFSNEAGLGSSPILHSAAESNSPCLQGMWSMFETFFDTFICCTLTALVILCSTSDFLVQTAFSQVTGSYSNVIIAFEMAVFAFCTVIGWYYCGETAFTYLFGAENKNIICVIFAVASALGAVAKMETVWTISDIFNGLMAFPNLLGLVLLINKVKKE